MIESSGSVSEKPVIKATALTRSYGDFVAVRDVSFSVEKNEIVSLLGHNGAGKSTLMKMLTGCLEPTSGSIELNGLDLSDNRKEAQRQLGYLPENCPLYSEMTVLEYLDYAADLRDVSPRAKAERILYAVEKACLSVVSTSKVSALSRGYRQRLGVAQALLNYPVVLILDEPTNGLDPSQILEMRSLIKELAENATVLISTHNLQEVRAVSSRVIILDQGRVVLDNSLAELQRTHRVEIMTDADGPGFSSAIVNLTGLKVLKVSKLGLQNQYIIEISDASDISEAAASISSALQDSGFKIFAVQHVVRDLETMFTAKTASNPEPAQTDE